jgi:hypothetical protein
MVIACTGLSCDQPAREAAACMREESSARETEGRDGVVEVGWSVKGSRFGKMDYRPIGFELDIIFASVL